MRYVLAALIALALTSAAHAGTTTRTTIKVGGLNREYMLFVPTTFVQPAPLVLAFHGGGSDATKMMRMTGLAELAEREGVIVAFPNGASCGLFSGRSWNTQSSGGDMGCAEKRGTDDVGFTKAVIADINARYRIDPARVYGTGSSKGAVFAHTLGCRMADQITAIAAVSGTMVVKSCAPSRPVNVLAVHGTADQNIPFAGGQGDAGNYSYQPVMNGLNTWAALDCNGSPLAEPISTSAALAAALSPPIGDEYSVAWLCSDALRSAPDVALVLIKGGGHGWGPGTTEIVWRFLKEQKR